MTVLKNTLKNLSKTSALVLFAAGCSKAPPPAPEPTAALASAAPAVTSAAPTAAGSAPELAISPPRALGEPAASRVGVLAAGTGIPVGKTVPEVRATDLEGKEVALSSLYAKGPILLAFYRGGWCPFCNMEIHTLVQAYPEYQKRGVTPVALSVDQVEAGAKMKATYTIPFPVLSDSDAKVLEAFHVVKTVEGEELAKMKGFGVDLEHYSGKPHHQIAIPSLFLIDQKGVVRWAHSDSDFKVRPSTTQILSAIDAAKL